MAAAALSPSTTSGPPLLLSRSGFLQSSFHSLLPFGLLGAGVSPDTATSSSSSVSVPLVFLPVAGCLAIPVLVRQPQPQQQVKDDDDNDNFYRYYAVADTGSPFLTAPPNARDFTTDASEIYPTTEEQYGATAGGVQWRRARVALGDDSRGTTGSSDPSSSSSSLVLGIPPDNVLRDTSGLFFGLMDQDDNRPTVLGQLGYQSLILDYAAKRLTFSRTPLLSSLDDNNNNNNNNNNILDMYDLTPYGPNLHHYSVACTTVTLLTRDGSKFPLRNLQRPVVVVIDSGLTGCILTDSWNEEALPVSSMDEIQGLDLQIGGGGGGDSNGRKNGESPNNNTIRLQSNPRYWNLSCFRLPWFSSDAHHPHIIAAGATFLVGSRLTVDAQRRRLRIEQQQQQNGDG